LGFAHEEEFDILALAAGGLGLFLLMVSYASSVAAALMGITIICAKVYVPIQDKLFQYNEYLLKITAGVLAIMAIVFFVETL